MKEVCLAAQMYAQDYDEIFGIYDWQAARMHVVVQPYIKNIQIMLCPSGYYGGCSNAVCPRTLVVNGGSMAGAGAAFAGYVSPYAGRLSYGWNRMEEAYGEINGISGNQGDIGICGRAMAYIKYPAETYFFSDWACTRQQSAAGMNAWNADNAAYTRHNDGGNMGYADGHAKWENVLEGPKFDARRP